MSAQHTPGPWPITETVDGKRFIIGEDLVNGPNGYEVAEVYCDDAPIEETMANARLIAAAPDLLSVAQAVNAAAKGGHDTIALLLELHRIGILADAALAKVTAS